MFGLALLFSEAALLTLITDMSGGQYVSPFGALRYDLLKQPLKPSTWPWAQESVGAILTTAVEDIGKEAISPVSEPLEVFKGLLGF
jgi:hypothetical protein